MPPGRSERDGFADFGGDADLAAEEIDYAAVELPERLRAGIKDGEQSIAVIDEKRRRIIGRLDGTLRTP